MSSKRTEKLHYFLSCIDIVLAFAKRMFLDSGHCNSFIRNYYQKNYEKIKNIKD